MSKALRSALQPPFGLLLGALVLLAAAPVPARAQECAPDVVPIKGELGYGPRDHGCEGMYVGVQSAPLNLRVVSLTQGTLRFDSTDSALEIHVPGSAPLIVDGDTLRAVVQIRGRPTGSGVNWRLDAEAVNGTPKIWNLAVVHDPAAQITAEQIGLMGETTGKARDTAPIYVPLKLAAPGTSPTDTETVHLIFQIPSAGVAEVCLDECEEAERITWGGYFDGYFKVELELSRKPPGLVPLTVRWRPSGGGEWGYDRLEIVRW